MKNAFRTILCLVLILSMTGFLWADKIRIKTENGVKVVYNPKLPSAPDDALTKIVFTKDFTVGENGEEMFSELTAFAVDDEGSIYTLDRKDSRIRVFDRNGKFVRRFGKKGQGPGELNQPVGLQITPEKELLVEDALNRRFVFFSLDGEFLRSQSVADKLSLVNVVMDSKRNLVGRELVPSEKKLTWHVKKYDRELKPLFTIETVEFQNPMEGKINPFLYLFFYDLDSKDSILYGNPKDYVIKVFSPEGKLIKKIVKEYDPIKITEKDKEEILERIPDVGFGIKERMEFPDHFPAYQYFSLDEHDRIFVRTFKKGKQEEEYIFDVFDEEGRFIAQFVHKAQPRVWKNGKMYAVEESEEGYQVLTRYSFRWEK
ncbi:MAG: 6-bladed beta-propeller [Candidatus Aminicenantales bacterium]